MVWVNKGRIHQVQWTSEETPQIDDPYAALRHSKRTGKNTHNLDTKHIVSNRFDNRDPSVASFALVVLPVSVLLVTVLTVLVLAVVVNIWFLIIPGVILALFMLFFPLRWSAHWLAKARSVSHPFESAPRSAKRSSILANLSNIKRFASSASPSVFQFIFANCAIAAACFSILFIDDNYWNNWMMIAVITAAVLLVLCYTIYVFLRMYHARLEQLVASHSNPTGTDADFSNDPQATKQPG